MAEGQPTHSSQESSWDAPWEDRVLNSEARQRLYAASAEGAVADEDAVIRRAMALRRPLSVPKPEPQPWNAPEDWS